MKHTEREESASLHSARHQPAASSTTNDRGHGADDALSESTYSAAGMFTAGEKLLGKYVVERELGRGGMGVVVAARHVELDELVAIKMVLPEHALNSELVGRFMQEARAAAKIKSEHVVRVSDVGRLATGEPYMVMELLEGEDLEAMLERRGPLPFEEAVDYVLQALEAVADAHAAGIIHRDLKPGNLFLTRRRDGTACVKVLDFGISKLTRSAGGDGGLTSTQGILGSPLYMSPEQLTSSKDVDVRTDIWALGVILYQLLTTSFPYDGEALPQMIAAVLGDAIPTSMHTLRADVPKGLDDVVSGCLAKSRDERFANVAELAEALLPFGPPHAAAIVRRIAAVVPTTGRVVLGSRAAGKSSDPTLFANGPPNGARTEDTTLTAGGSTTTRPSRRRLSWLLAGIAMLVVSGGAVSIWLVERTSVAHRSATSTSSSLSERRNTPDDPRDNTGNSGSNPSTEAAGANSAANPSTASTADLGAGMASASTAASANTQRPGPDSLHGNVGTLSKKKPNDKGATSSSGAVAGANSSASAPHDAPKCTPPYTLDAAGHRVPKPECM
jgi:eukaryotic-like serine/threonine-protein kinase